LLLGKQYFWYVSSRSVAVQCYLFLRKHGDIELGMGEEMAEPLKISY